MLKTKNVSSSVYAGRDFHGIAFAALGPRGTMLTHIALILATFGALAGYLVIIGDMVRWPFRNGFVIIIDGMVCEILCSPGEQPHSPESK